MNVACCGQRRAALSAAATTNQPKPDASGGGYASQAASPENSGRIGANYAQMNLRYLNSTTIRMRGPATGRGYTFSAADPVQSVDMRDAAIVLRSGFFRKT